MDPLLSYVTNPKYFCKNITQQIYSVSSYTVNLNILQAFLSFVCWRVNKKIMSTYYKDELDADITPKNLESRRKNHRLFLRDTWTQSNNQKKSTVLILLQLSVFGRHSQDFSYPLFSNYIKAHQPVQFSRYIMQLIQPWLAHL